MREKVEQNPENLNPVLNISKDGTVLYSNEAGEPILNEWGVRVGEKVPSSIVDLAQKVISRNSPEKIEVKVGKKVYLVVFHPLPEEQRVSISGFDISDQKDLELKSQESEEDLAEVQKIAHIGNWKWNIVTNELFWSDEVYRIFGLNPQEFEVTFDAYFNYVHPDDRDYLCNSIKKAFEGKPYSIDNRILIANGKEKIVHTDAEITFNEDNVPVYARGIVQDITERKRAEKALRDSEEKYRIVADNTYDWEFWLNPNGSFLYLSPSCERVTGYAVWEFIDNPELLQEIIHLDDRQAFLQHQHVMLSSRQGDIEFRIVTKDGEIRWIHHLCQSLYDDEGHYTGSRGSNREITERKRTEETLAFERSQLLSIFDGMDDVVYVTDPYTFEVLYANKAMKDKFDGELVGGICYQEFQRGDSPCDFCTNRIILKDKDKPYYWEYYNESVDRHFMIMDRIIKWPDGRDVRLEIAKDITDRKRAEQALKEAYDTLEEKITERTVELQEAYNSLKESEERLADAQKIAHIGSYDWDITTNEEYWSDELFHIFGLDPNLEINHNKFLNQIHPDDLEYVNNAITEAINRKPYDITYRVILPGGEERVIYSQGGVIFDEKNKPIRMRGIVQDITELKKSEEKLRDSEEKYRNIVETANEIILITNNKEVITFVNKKIEDMLGYSLGEVISKPIWSFISKDYRPFVKQNLEKRRQGISESYEAKLIRKDGSTVWVLLNAKPLFNRESKYVGAMSMLTDITQRKEAEEALAKIETARKKEIHHRIKNNLQVISSLLDLQAEKFKNIGYIKDLEVLEAFRESQDRVRSMSLIHEELYKGEGVDIFDFSSYIKELTKNLFLTYRLGNANISLNLDLEENLFFDMDIATPLGLIINELVSNSLKHAFTGRYKGEIQIKLFHEKTEDYTNSIEGNKSEGCKSTNFFLIVSDNGVGIPENVDIKNTYTLGLQLVSSLVDQLDGKLELKRNKGTEFTIRFTVKGKII